MTRDARRALVPAGLVLAGLALLYSPPVFRGLGPRAALWIYDLAVITAASAGVGLAWRLWRSFDRGEVLRRIWAALGLWLALWTIGELVWSYDQLVAGETLPSPSLADLAWLMGYVAIAVGLWMRYRSFRISLGRGWRFLLFWSFTVAAGVLVASVTAPIVADSDPAHLAASVVNVLYPLGDLAMAIGAIAVALVVIRGALSVPWSLIAAGLLLASASDLLYVHGLSTGAYQFDPSGAVNGLTFTVNILYAASYLVVAAGLYVQGRIQRIL